MKKIDTHIPQYKFMVTANPKGMYAIRIVISGVEYIAEPYKIFNTLYLDKSYILLYLNEEDYCNNKATLRVDTELKYDDVRWTYKMAGKMFSSFISFVKREYIANIENALNQLKAIIETGMPVVYNDKRNFYYKYTLYSEVSWMCEQIRNTKEMLELLYPRLKNVTVENFSFCFTEEYSCDTGYEIVLGDRRFKSCLSDWSNELEHIRYMLEAIVYRREAEVKICFEDEPTTIILKERCVRTNENTCSNDEQYKIMEVKVIPNSFVKGPVLYGYCRREQVVRTLYQGLLKLSMRYSKWFERDLGYELISWKEYKMVIYNKFKSPIIEDYINKIVVEEYSFRNRQREIKRIFTIRPDCINIALFDEEGCAYPCDEDTLELCIDDKNYITINIPGIEKWQHDFECSTDFAETKTKDDFNWIDWHKRGIELAKQLREQLPLSCDLWYDSPFEDKSGTIKESFLVM